MKKILKILSLLPAAVLFVGTVAATGVQDAAANAADGYYAPITATGGTALLGQVHDLITATHTYYTSYNDCKNPDYVKRTDPGPNGQLMEFYAQAELSSKWESGAAGTWNREHVWCKSHSGGLWGTSGGGSDLLHIRPTEERVNSARNNDLYGEVSAKTPVWYRDKSNTQIAIAGYSAGTVFEPKDEVKGDVARIVLYMYAHYNTYQNVGGTTNGNGASYYFGTLRFANIMSPSTEEAAVELLLKWNALDPPDELEAARNEAAEEIQGNRNPFVDHPEYADLIWGDPAAELAALSIRPSSLSLTVGETATLSVTAAPASASNEVVWSVSDPSVLSIEDGTVTAKGEGTATVTATSTVKPDIKATATVTVTRSPDELRLEAFGKAVSELVRSGPLGERLASLNRAISAYAELTEENKAAAEEEIGILREAISEYNRLAEAYNADAEQANGAAVHSAGGPIAG